MTTTPPETITFGQWRHLKTARRVADMLRESGPLNASEIERRTNVDHEGHPLIDANDRPLYPRQMVQDALWYLTLRGAVERSVGNRGAITYTFVTDDLIEDAGPKPAPRAPIRSGDKLLADATLDDIASAIANAIVNSIAAPSVTIEAAAATPAATTAFDDWDF